MQDLLKKLLFGNAGGSNGGAPSLNLSFVDGGTFDPRITFSRGTNATLTGSDGLIQWAPNNLLTNSEDFEAAAWVKLNGTVVSNQAVAPDGTTTAELLYPTTTGTFRGFYQTFTASVGAYTTTVYAKAAGLSSLGLTDLAGSAAAARFDLVSGTVGFTAAGYTASIQSVGNGWYRCSVTGTAAAGLQYVYAYACDSASTNTATTSGTSGIFLWGAQLNVGSTAQSYNSTTPKNLLGFTQEPENAAWTKSNSYVQQNLLLQSQDFATTWVNSRTAVTVNTTVAPDGSITADTIAEDNQTGSTGRSQTVSTVAGVSYTFSCFLKNIDRRYVQLMVYASATANYISAAFDLVAQTSTTAANGTGYSVTSASVVDVGNGWFRCSITGVVGTTPAVAAAISPRPDATAGGFPNYAGTTLAFYAWGAQLVQGATAGDYTQTTSAAAPTRYTNWDGTLTGRKLVEDTAAATTHRVFNGTGATVPTNGAAANIVYAKAGERTAVRLTDNDIQGADFDLLTGAVSNIGSGVTAAATNVGGGWWRLSVIRTNSTGTGRVVLYLISGGTITYTGDGTSGIYVSDFQLSNSASVDPYVYNPQAAAASAAYYGPRFDYDPTGTPVLGSELVVNGEFTNGSTGWTISGAWAASGGQFVKSGASNATASQAILTIGRTYQITLDVAAVSGGSLLVYAGSGSAISFTTTGSKTAQLVCSGDTGLYLQCLGAVTATVDNVSVKEVTGYTATANGLLIEEQRANLLTRSEDFGNATWSKTTCTISTDATTSPAGDSTADKLIPDVGVTTYNIIQGSISKAAVATTYTYTIYVKNGGFQSFTLYINDNAATANRVQASFNISTVTTSSVSAAGTFTAASASLVAVGNGWYRCVLTGTSSTETAIQVRLLHGTGTGDGTSGLFIWGAQLEAGSFATSYIPTVASQVTRNADSASMLGDNFYTWYNPNQGTLLTEGGGSNAAGSARLAGISDGTVSNRIINYLSGATQLAGLISAGGAAQANPTVNVTSSASANKLAHGYLVNNVNIAANGTLGTLDTVATIPAVTLMRIGVDEAGTGAILNGTIRSIRYYTVRLPDATLQQITS